MLFTSAVLMSWLIIVRVTGSEASYGKASSIFKDLLSLGLSYDHTYLFLESHGYIQQK